MQCIMLKSKLHRVSVTHTVADGEDACLVDASLLQAADIAEYQQVHIYNVSNGARFSTHARPAPPGSGTVALSGPAARLASVGDLLIIASYAAYNEAALQDYAPRLIYVDATNRIVRTSDAIPAQPAATPAHGAPARNTITSRG